MDQTLVVDREWCFGLCDVAPARCREAVIPHVLDLKEAIYISVFASKIRPLHSVNQVKRRRRSLESPAIKSVRPSLWP